MLSEVLLDMTRNIFYDKNTIGFLFAIWVSSIHMQFKRCRWPNGGTHDMHNITYIFISGYHKKYRQNIYRTLFSPTGTINRYVFKSAGLVTVIKRLKWPWLLQQKVLIVFVDRYGGANNQKYVYYPIRNAILKKYVKEGDERTAFYVELRDYIFPKSCDDIQGDITRMGDIPKRSSDTDSTDDGQYITIWESIIDKEHYYLGADAWNAAAKELQTKRAFLAMEEEKLDSADPDKLDNMVPFFYRLEYEQKRFRTYKPIRPVKTRKDTCKGLTSVFRFSSKADCRARIHYYFPFWAKNSSVELQLSMKSDSMQDDGKRVSLPNEGESCQGTKLFSTLAVNGEIFFDVQAQGLAEGKTLVNFTQNISSQVQDHKAVRWFFISIAAIIYVMCGFLFDYFGLPKDQSIELSAYFLENWQQLLVSAIQILAIIFIAWLNGGESLLS